MEAEDDREAGRVRKRRFSSARIQPTRVKKVMQSDEEIGRMIASVPVAMCASMEHFAEKLLESAAQCVQSSSARTLTPSHIRYAILNNRHFSFLQELTQDIQSPRIDESGEHSGAQKASTANTGHHPLAQFPSELLHLSQFPPNIYQQQHNFQQFPQPVISPFNYDLNANASHQRPVQFLKEQETALIQNMATSNIRPQVASEIQRRPPISVNDSKPTQSKPPLNETPLDQGKRKRGRPRKEKKDKFVETTANEVPIFPNPSDTSNGFAIGTTATTPEELDRLLMPPPAATGLARRSVPNRESVNNENSECTTTSNRTTNSSTKTSLTAV